MYTTSFHITIQARSTNTRFTYVQSSTLGLGKNFHTCYLVDIYYFEVLRIYFYANTLMTTNKQKDNVPTFFGGKHAFFSFACGDTDAPPPKNRLTFFRPTYGKKGCGTQNLRAYDSSELSGKMCVISATFHRLFYVLLFNITAVYPWTLITPGSTG